MLKFDKISKIFISSLTKQNSLLKTRKLKKAFYNTENNHFFENKLKNLDAHRQYLTRCLIKRVKAN